MFSGIPYFPLECKLDDKLALIEAEFGLTGFGVVVKLWQKIYSLGYYLEWTNEVGLLFAREVGLGGSSVSEIVSAAIKRGIFDNTMYKKYQILTSAGIQKRYFEAVKRRKIVEVDTRYLLVKVTDFLNPACISGKNVSISDENVDISKQRKEEKRKEEKRNTPLPPTGGADRSLFDVFWAAYPKKKAKADAEKAFKALKVDEALLSVLLSSLEKQKASPEWAKEHGQYIPYPATWLRGKRWNDEEVTDNGGTHTKQWKRLE